MEYARSDLNGTAFHFNEWNEVGLIPYEYTGNFSITENKYLHGIGLENLAIYSNEGSGSIEYNLNSKYVKLTGYLGIDDHFKNSSNTNKVIIYGDGKVLYESPDMMGGDLPVYFDVNLTGVKRLKIEISTTGEDYKSNNLLVIAEPKLFQ